MSPAYRAFMRKYVPPEVDNFDFTGTYDPLNYMDYLGADMSLIDDTIVGDVSLGAGQFVTNKRIEGRLILTHPTAYADNCEVVGPNAAPTSDDTALVLCTSSGLTGTGAWLRRLTIRPQYPHWDWNGVRGWRVHTERLLIEHVVDGFSLFPPSSQAGADCMFLDKGSLVRELSRWTEADAGVPVHPSDTQTHNDCCQIHGGQNFEFQGTRFMAQQSLTVGSGPDSSNLTYRHANAGIQVNQISGYGPTRDIRLRNAHFDYGYSAQINVSSALSGVALLDVQNSTFSKRTSTGIRLSGSTFIANVNNVHVEDGTPVAVTA